MYIICTFVPTFFVDLIIFLYNIYTIKKQFTCFCVSVKDDADAEQMCWEACIIVCSISL